MQLNKDRTIFVPNSYKVCTKFVQKVAQNSSQKN